MGEFIGADVVVGRSPTMMRTAVVGARMTPVEEFRLEKLSGSDKAVVDKHQKSGVIV